MRKRIPCLIILLVMLAFAGRAGEDVPEIFGNWKLVRVIGENSDIKTSDIGKIVSFDKKGRCHSFMECLPKESGYNLTKRFSYATGRKAWLVTFSNTMASDYEVYKANDTLYLLCNCSVGRNFVFAPTTEKLVLPKTDSVKSKVIVSNKVVVKPPVPKSPSTVKPIIKAKPVYHALPPKAQVKKPHAVIKSRPGILPTKKTATDSTNK